jgi:hypothetical protein
MLVPDTQDKRKKKNKLKDNTKVMLFRWWLAGAVYFFLAFGSSLGKNLSSIDLTFMLAVATSFLTILVFNPVMYSMYDITKHGKIVNEFYKHHTISEGVVMKLIEFFKCSFSVVLVSLTYYYANIFLIKITESQPGDILLKGEPFLFATLFIIYYQLLSLLPSFPVQKSELEDLEKGNRV